MEFFPKITEQARRGNFGVELVSSIVSNELQWLFRKVHAENDFGIDGYIDVVLEDRSVTGQSFAVQIKTGESFFATKNSVGFAFYGEKKHLNYYLNSQIPILIVLCNPVARLCYWELFDGAKTEGTPTGWKLVVPSTQLLSSFSKKQLLEIVGPAVDHVAELEKHWAFNELLRSMGAVHFAVSRSDIEAQNSVHITSFFERLVANTSTCGKLQGKIDFSIFGYEEDNRELWQIPEVREWFRLVEPKVKYWLYFLDSNPRAAGLLVLFACLCEIETSKEVNTAGKRQVALDLEAMVPIIERNFDWLNEMTERMGLSEAQNEKISRDAMKILLPDYA